MLTLKVWSKAAISGDSNSQSDRGAHHAHLLPLLLLPYRSDVSYYIQLLHSILSEKLSEGSPILPLLLRIHSFILVTNPY